MKKINFFIMLFAICSSFIISARSVNITLMNGAIVYIDDNQTVAQLFRFCRNQGLVENSQRLVLYYANYEIIENSQASNQPLYYFGANVDYATIGYYQPNYNNNYQDYQNHIISIRAPNGMVRTMKANQTPALFFRSCRSAGHCASIAPMTLKFDIYEIIENTPAANKHFYEFNTDAQYAYVMNWDTDNNNSSNYNSNYSQVDTVSVFGATLCGLGLIYFLNNMW